MTSKYENCYFGKNPALYGQDLAKSLRIKNPPVDEEVVADFLGYKIVRTNLKNYPAWLPFMDDIFKQSPSHLFKKENIIVVNSDIPWLRQRLSIFHEYGHDIYPLHTGLNFSCHSVDLDVNKLIERQAFQAGIEVPTPRQLIIPNIYDLPIELNSIKRLATTYDLSREAMAIRFADIHYGKCAVIVTEPSSVKQNFSLIHKHDRKNHDDCYQIKLDLKARNTKTLQPEDESPLRIKYINSSPRFQEHLKIIKTYIKAGIGINEDNIIYKAFETQKRIEGEIPASVFGSSKKFTYLAECEPLGDDGSMLVLLKLEDPQLMFSFRKEIF